VIDGGWFLRTINGSLSWELCMNIPTKLTVLRIIFVPLVAVVYVLPFWWCHAVAAVLFFLAIITDWFDGYLARKLNQMTKLGAFLDPVADKIIISTLLVLVSAYYASVWVSIPAVIIVAREIVISALREWMAEIGSKTKVGVRYIGKVKTTFQAISIIGLVMYTPSLPAVLFYLSLLLFYVSAILTIWSMFIYLKTAWPDLRQHSGD